MALETPQGLGWSGVNTALAICATLTLTGAICVFLMGVALTRGVYGSRMAWLLGVVLPLLAITAGLAWGAAKYGLKAGTGFREEPYAPSPQGESDHRRSSARGLGILAVVLIGVPFSLAALLLLVYGLLFIAHVIR